MWLPELQEVLLRQLAFLVLVFFVERCEHYKFYLAHLLILFFFFFFPLRVAPIIDNELYRL